MLAYQHACPLAVTGSEAVKTFDPIHVHTYTYNYSRASAQTARPRTSDKVRYAENGGSTPIGLRIRSPPS